MTIVGAAQRARAAWLAPAVLTAGTIALLVRPYRDSAIVPTLLVGAAGVIGARAFRGPACTWTCRAQVLSVGTMALLSARLMGPAVTPAPTRFLLIAAAVAAIGEEAFFRGFMAGWLRPAGAAVAIVVPAVAFALIHVPVYGVGILPLDLAAGLVLGWQRWATGGWGVPAATHLLANLILFL